MPAFTPNRVMADTEPSVGDSRTDLTAPAAVFTRGEHEDEGEGEDAATDDSDEDEQPASGEGEDPTTTDDPPRDDDTPLTALRVAHFSPDAPAVDVYVDDERVVTGLEYDSKTPYLALEPGTYTLTVTPAGEDDSVLERTAWFGRAYYTVAAIGSVELGTLRPHILVDDGSVLLRVIHAVPDAPAVDLYVNQGDTPIVADLAYGTATGYVAIPAASYTIDVTPAGEGKDAAVGSFDVDLERGLAYTAVATGRLEEEPDRPFGLRAMVDGPMAGR